MSLCLLNGYDWFWPVCASSPTIVSSGEEMEHSWVEGVLGFYSVGRRLMPWSKGREFSPTARVGAEAFIVSATGCSYLRSLRPLLLIMLSYFSTPSMVLAVRRTFCLLQLWRVDLTHVRSAVQSLAPLYLCQVGSAVSGRHAGDLVVQGRKDVAAKSIFAISSAAPPEETFSRCPIRVLKMRSCAELWVCSGVKLVLLGRLRG
ncbi:hypothetical protein GW17_00047196 [Ensete ventricosum]|nr:hypothetical protein GW17_00047196 [Ensete ventricosum]